MSSPGSGMPASAAGGPRSLRIATRVAEAVWFVGVPLSLLFIFRLPFAETLAAFVVWLVVLLGLERVVAAKRPPVKGPSNPSDDDDDGRA
jgi:hypothetical protein